MKKSPQTTAPAAQIKQKTEWTPYLLILPAVVRSYVISVM